MPLKIKKWSLETNLELVNYGKGTMEVYTSMANDKERKGKLFTIGAEESKFVTVKDFLPSGIAEPWKLGDIDFEITVNNISTEDIRFNVLEEGPFRKSEFAQEYQSEAHRIIGEYNIALMEADKFTMKLLVKDAIPEEYKVDKNFYSLICHVRAKVFDHLHRYEESDMTFEEGWKYYRDDQRLHYSIDWADSLIDKIFADKNAVDIGKTIEKAIRVLDFAKLYSKNMPFEKYNEMAVDGMKAFCICYLGETEQARKLFDNFDFNPIPFDDFTDPLLHFFFAKIGYGIMVAIELRDVDLVRNISQILSTGRPELLKEPSVQMSMRRAFGNVHENGRDEINNSFNAFINNRTLYAAHFPNLAEFLEYISVGNETSMNSYFGYIG